MRLVKKFLFTTLIFSMGFLDQPAQPVIDSISSLRFIGEYIVPHNKPFRETTIGGLSGIDYVSETDEYYFISDDRSAINPARFYKARILYSEKGIDSVQFTDVQFLLMPDGKRYPGVKQDPWLTPDPEAIRYNGNRKQLVWTSEGERIFKGKDTVLSNPSITIMHPNGKYISNVPVPSGFSMSKVEKGPRKNGTFEGLSYADDYKRLFVSLEEPLYDDGPRIDIKENNVPIRILKYDLESGKLSAQYAYIPDPVAFPSNPPEEFKINGVPDILYIGNNKLLVIERSFSTGKIACTVKVFLADLNDADNVMSMPSLKGLRVKTVQKKLILNMDELGIYIDNIEGFTIGHDLPNGHKTLVFMADNNFETFEKTQFLVFEVMP